MFCNTVLINVLILIVIIIYDPILRNHAELLSILLAVPKTRITDYGKN